MISNDVKWNKIKQIESNLSEYWITIHYYYRGNERIANQKTWELANKLYDIATEGCCLHHNNHNSTFPQDWRDVIEEIKYVCEDDDEDSEDENYLKWIRFENYKWGMEERDQIWKYYDYLNS